MPVPVLCTTHDGQIEVHHPFVPHEPSHESRGVREVTHHLQGKLLQPRFLQHTPAERNRKQNICSSNHNIAPVSSMWPSHGSTTPAHRGYANDLSCVYILELKTRKRPELGMTKGMCFISMRCAKASRQLIKVCIDRMQRSRLSSSFHAVDTSSIDCIAVVSCKGILGTRQVLSKQFRQMALARTTQ